MDFFNDFQDFDGVRRVDGERAPFRRASARSR
jgi:hypothetical protein